MAESDTAAGRGRLHWSEAHWTALTALSQPGELASVLHCDQRRRWRRGQRSQVELYLEDFPSLAAETPEARAATVDLIFHEFCLREEFGPPPNLEEFRQRFPRLIERLSPRLTVHQLLQDVDRPTDTAPSAGLGEGGEEEFPAVPRYEIFRELGRGGMGVVYLASQEGLDRFVALKMILPGAPVSADDLRRFRIEAAAMSRVQHPNLVQIYEVGEFRGLPYFSLEFVDGGSLEDKLKGEPMAPNAAARLAATLAQALHCAHRQGIIHRDLKPANVLLTSDGVPKITDFGVAKRSDKGGKASTESVMGTPVYMAPEQARAQNDKIGPATDVYSLGAMVYELLTGTPPYVGETVQDTLLKVLYEELKPPSQHQSGIPRRLETIVVKCLEKEPGKRFASAEELAEEFERFLSDTADENTGKSGRGWLARWLKGE
jgi:serine/threonine-protein kinase